MKFRYPNTIYNIHLVDRGDVLELRNPLFKEMFGDVIDVDSTGVAYNTIDLSKRLTSLGYTATLIEDKKLFISKGGVHAYIIFSKYLAYENTSVRQIQFTMEGFKQEQEGILNKVKARFHEQMKHCNNLLESGINGIRS